MVLGKRKADGGQSVVGSPPAAKKQHGSSGSFSKASRAPAVLSRAERAALRKERRASKPHHDIIENANQLYRFDFKRMDGAERRTKIAELMERTAGKVVDVLTKHDTSRVFQLMVKYGSAEQRQRMQAECKGSILGLCLNHYAHHFVLKLLQYGSPVVRAAVWRELQGNVTQLAFHADGAVVFDYLYASEKSKKQQRDILRGLLHPSFALDAQTFALTNNDSSATSPSAASDSGTLLELCGSHASIAASMVQHVGGLLEKWLNKDQLQYRFVHSLLRQYLELPAALLPRSTRAELISSVCSSPSLSALSGSNDGVLVLCMAVSDGVAKDRKQVMRCLKSDALSVCRSMYGHLLLMRVADCVDDTVAVDKNVWSGLLSSPYAVSQLIDDVHGAKVVRFMLKGKASSQFLSPFEATFQRQSQLNNATVDGSITDGTSGSSSSGLSGSTGSKKDSVLRHEEHLAHCLLPLMSIFQLDDYIRDNPPALPASHVASKAASADNEDDEAEQQPQVAVSLEALLRSPAASPVLLELLHTAQASCGATDDNVKAAALIALRPQLQQSLDAALDKLALVVQQPGTPKEEERSGEHEEQAADDPQRVSGSEPQPSLLEDKTAHYFFKRLLAPNAKSKLSPTAASQPQLPSEADRNPPSASSVQLGQHFAQRLLRAFHTSPAVLSSAASSNRGCFVLLALLEALDSAQQQALAQLCQQQKVRSAIETATSQHDGQQGHPQPAGSKKRKRGNSHSEESAAAASAEGTRGGVVMTGCSLLRAWLDGKQSAVSTACERVQKRTASGSQAEESAVISNGQGMLAVQKTSQLPDSGSMATVSKRPRVAAKRK